VTKAPQVLEYHADTQKSISPELEPTVAALAQLPPQSQEIAINLIRDLARQHGITVPHTMASGLQTPIEGLAVWEAYLIANASEGTRGLYTYWVKRILLAIPIPNTLLIQQHLATELQRGVSKSAVACQLKALKSFFNCLYDNGLWASNPVAKLKNPKVGKKERKIPPEEDVLRLLEATRTLKERSWVSLLIDTACRYCEIVTLRWEQIDFDKRLIRVLGKGDKERYVDISTFTVNVLREYRQTLNGHEAVFPTRDKRGRWNIHDTNRMLEKLCRRAGIAKVTNHQIRHAVATHLLNEGGEGAIKSVSELLGHANTAITVDTYIHTERKRVQRLHQEHGFLSDSTKLLK